MAGGDYEASLAVPIADADNDGYFLNIVFDDLLKYAFLASAIGGSSGTHLHDHWWAHRTGQTNILLAGGSWVNGVNAGVGCRCLYYVATNAGRFIGARLEFTG